MKPLTRTGTLTVTRHCNRQHTVKHIVITQYGFTYVIILVAVVVLGILVEAAHKMTEYWLKSEREAELIFRGQAYRRAIQSYHEAGKVTKYYPRDLAELLNDPRFAQRRHIRKLYTDPMGKPDDANWILVRAADGGIAGVTSASQDIPLKQANFPAGLESLAKAKSYSEWVFDYRIGVVTPTSSSLSGNETHPK